MSRFGRSRRRSKEPPELEITSFMNLMVVLVPFLLVSAVFSRMGILELNLPAAAAPGGEVLKPELVIEVIVREKGMEISNGKTVLVRMPKIEALDDDIADDTGSDTTNGNSEKTDEKQYDLQLLTKYLLKIKSEYPDKKDATVLLEPDIQYMHLVDIMDRVRIAVMMQGDNPEPQKVELFPEISIGDAP